MAIPMRPFLSVPPLALALLVSFTACEKPAAPPPTAGAQSAAPPPLDQPSSGPTSRSADKPPSPTPSPRPATATPPTPTATASAAPPATASAAPPPSSSGAAPPGPVTDASLDACCAALTSLVKAGTTKAQPAATMCPGVSRLVKAGRQPRAAGAAQIRAALGGAPAPAACN